MKTRKDIRASTLALTILVVGALGLILAWQRTVQENPGAKIIRPALPGSADASAEPDNLLDPEFLLALSALRSGDDQAAVSALLSFRKRAPHVPELHVNLGFALLGTGQPGEAESSFQQALELRPEQANAYYGLGLVYENRGDLESARGAMRTFIHLTTVNDPFLPKARAALWEWEADANVVPIQ